ncbi:hypothetical protein CVT25_007535 [Psilocybe cyanescens]|uniref:Uncharacterized protein n=1 Tax=Psilocybe cyanescens TaxID=93625 RepID=A0A409XGF3_PSICY|nr:hypothetical protein CVT25_007535 [Psilocybe cyanescens]
MSTRLSSSVSLEEQLMALSRTGSALPPVPTLVLALPAYTPALHVPLPLLPASLPQLSDPVPALSGSAPLVDQELVTDAVAALLSLLSLQSLIYSQFSRPLMSRYN